VVAEEVEEEGVAEADMGAALVDKEEAMGVVTVAPAVPMGAAMAEVMEAATGAATEIEITIRAAVSEDVQEVVDGVEAVDEVVVEEAEVAAFATNFNGRVRVRLGTNVDFPTAKINPILFTPIIPSIRRQIIFHILLFFHVWRLPFRSTLPHGKEAFRFN